MTTTGKYLRLATRCAPSTSTAALQDAFRDPTSPFYLAPGEVGPSDAEMWPNGPPGFDDAPGRPGTLEVVLARQADKHAREAGYDPLSFWEQKIVWGDLDSFRHLNNVRYVRFIESGRMKYFSELAKCLSAESAKNMLEGKGKSLILKKISVNFKRPVVYPDTLLVSHRPHSLEPTRFHLSTSLYSYSQQAEVASSDSICVWYDYDTLKKCEAPADIGALLQERAALCVETHHHRVR
ncbi:hypothetical protein FRB90_007985 [Tulasnella sp. 427]|nr:hypothetical protein FRB90_007985 [Tulasnella sp. 427]